MAVPRHTIMVYREVAVQLHSFLTLALHSQPRASAVLFASSCQYQFNRRLGGWTVQLVRMFWRRDDHCCNWNCRSCSLQLNNYTDWARLAPKSHSTICHIMQQEEVLELLRQAVKISNLYMQMQLSRKCRQLHYLDQPHNLQTAHKLYELTIQGHTHFIWNSSWVKSHVWICVLEKSVTHYILSLNQAPCHPHPQCITMLHSLHIACEPVHNTV